MVDKITVPNAKGSILWLIGEYCDKVPKIAPDVLRKAAKAFIQEVKLTLKLLVNRCLLILFSVVVSCVLTAV